MISGDNLLSMTRLFISPDIVQKFCLATGEPYEKTREVLRTGIPTIVLGIVNKALTLEGAESVLNMAQEQPIEESEISPRSIKESNITKGNDFLKGVFENNLGNVVTNLVSKTGMKAANVTKMLGLATPLVIGAVGIKVKRENLTAKGLMNFLNQQRGALAGLFADGLGEAVAESENQVRARAKKSTIGILILIILSIVALIWWFMNQNIGKTTSIKSTQSRGQVAYTGMEEIKHFFQTASPAELPKRFYFENLHFKKESITLADGNHGELDVLTDALKEYPSIKIRLEGFAHILDSAYDENRFSLKLATTVKKQLVIRGIDPERIEVLGRGDVSPKNEKAKKNWLNDNTRVELVVTGI